MMISCPYCASSLHQVKAGIHGGKQRYKCALCSRRYVPGSDRRGYPEDLRERARHLRAQGETHACIAQALNVHPKSVANWLRETLDTPKRAASHSSLTGDIATVPDAAAQRSRRRRSTIEDVAKSAQVSTSTVSNFINRTGRMSVETSERIRAAMDELSFAPSALMRGLRRRRTGIVGVYIFGLDYLHENVGHAVTPPLLAGINHAAHLKGHNLLLFTGYEADQKNPSWEQFLDGHIDGLLWVAPELKEPSLNRLAAAGLPVVAVLTRHVPPGVGYVNADNLGGVEAAVWHLFTLGHSRIAYAGRVDASNYIDRREGYRRGLKDVGLVFDPELEATGAINYWHFEGFSEALDRWLALPSPPTAMIMPDDRHAAWLIRTLTSKGLRVPQDVAVVGYDDVPNAATEIGQGLTTVRQDFRLIGGTAVDLVIKMIGGASADDCRVTLPTTLMVRYSTVGSQIHAVPTSDPA